jgi:asparagine synthase (glutamine-hydrolysing)
MCGIFGILASDRAASQEILGTAARSLAHRGPDDTGTAAISTGSPNGHHLHLTHTRLSIIDLSPLGHQPMQDPSTGSWIVFNGEIYNFRDLRAELEAMGNSFNSHSDTEVILTAYRAWAEDAFRRLRGMFAFAIWDAVRQRLLLVRDPMGIKPLYYFDGDRRFLFASEIRTLIQTGLVPRKLDPNGLLSFLTFGSVYEPWTILEGVTPVPAGHVVTVYDGSVTSSEYRNPMRPNGSKRDSETSAEAAKELPRLLRDAVISHLVSDVPVGVFLSGGIDSSSLVAIMDCEGIRPSTFSLVFREQEFNEAEHSRMVARAFSSDHHEIMVSQQDALSSIPDALRAMDQPTIDGINTWLVSRKTRLAGIKVALSGLGADEMFAGYSNFRRVPQMEIAAKRFSRLPSRLRRPVAASIMALGRNHDRTRKLSELAGGDGSPVHPYFLVRALFSSAERRALSSRDPQTAETAIDRKLCESILEASHFDPVNRVSYLESRWYMRNTLLRDADFMSMAHGLELRVPFLDHALVEACFRISGKEKVRGNLPKSLLLKSLGIKLPQEIVRRPKKGFTLPFERWLRTEMKSLVASTLQNSGSFRDSLNPSAVKDVWTRFVEGQTSWSRPWSLFVLESWCRQNL